MNSSVNSVKFEDKSSCSLVRVCSGNRVLSRKGTRVTGWVKNKKKWSSFKLSSYLARRCKNDYKFRWVDKEKRGKNRCVLKLYLTDQTNIIKIEDKLTLRHFMFDWRTTLSKSFLKWLLFNVWFKKTDRHLLLYAIANVYPFFWI